jgi:myosin light chain 6
MATKKMIEKDDALLKDIFDLYDTTGTEKIDVSYLGQCLRAAGLNPTQAEVRKVERDFGKNMMAYEEFLPIYHSVSQHCMTNEKKVSSEGVIDCFKHFDRTESGFISSSMFRHVLTSLGEKLTDEEFDVLVSGYVNNRGEIDYENMVKEILMIE